MDKKTNQSLIMLLVIVSIASMLSILPNFHQLHQQQAYAASKTSDLKQNVKQHMGQDNFCLRSDDCKQADESQQIVGEDNAATGFNDQSNTIATPTNTDNSSALPPGTTATPGQPQRPGQVTGLSATAAGSSQINLSWSQNPANENIVHYNVYRGTTPNFTVNTATDTPIAQPTTTTYSDTGLSASTTYYYKVAAVNSNGVIGPLSAETSATTPAEDDGINAILRLGFEGVNPGENNPVTGYEWGGAQYDKTKNDPLRLQAVDKNEVVPTPTGTKDPTGTKALKVTVKNGDVATNSAGAVQTEARAEVVLTKALQGHIDQHFREGDDIWFHWYTLFPLDYGTANGFQAWTQWHQSDGFVPPDCKTGCSPVVEFTVKEPNLVLRILGHTYDNANPGCFTFEEGKCGYKWIAPLQKGHWYEMLLHVKWSTDPQKGFMELYVDKQRANPTILDRSITFSTLDGDGLVYMKQGLYRDDAIKIPQTVYHDGMTVVECKNPTTFNYHPDTDKCNTTPPYQ
jgi:hypothetical protein